MESKRSDGRTYELAKVEVWIEGQTDERAILCFEIDESVSLEMALLILLKNLYF